ncbi:hypothetical protein XENTR_v10008428 [Xenopus tropicalis]|uniref:deoxyguanosine kinase n=2 Tax=Xenopus tropicalis TaxID=8364 RepID=A0A803JWR9_XENTR|nr:deoxyguanosine kinase, mitochondrial isoform X1 [Xenopus tropicalis]XP_012815320.2 deoxyguanosine kinase, mitochondrial isoform X1 [Xenopus tropicalis]KAE8615158.1 hypothetical protein XENTR_v10008428 [Xenopus tropicalis]KAE8615159.1 hypothetical protein XENTR_v10008428 [Xenopus tropicalis]
MFLSKVWRLLDATEILCCYSRKTKLNLFCTFVHRDEKQHVSFMENQISKLLQQSISPDPNSRKEMQVKKLSVEGNIAVGKSTFLKLLSNTFQEWSFATEPLKKWQNVQSTSFQTMTSSKPPMDNLLQLMYDDPTRWSYTFQTFSCMSRFKIQIQPLSEQVLHQQEPVQIFERSVYSDRYIFAKTLYELQHLNEIEWTLYQEWHTFLIEEFSRRVALDGIIYLRASPEKCFQRLQKRARKEEKTLQCEYLEKLHDQHESWLTKKTTEVHFENMKNIPVLLLDVEEDFENNSAAGDDLNSRVKAFVAGL